MGSAPPRDWQSIVATRTPNMTPTRRGNLCWTTTVDSDLDVGKCLNRDDDPKAAWVPGEGRQVSLRAAALPLALVCQCLPDVFCLL